MKKAVPTEKANTGVKETMKPGGRVAPTMRGVLPPFPMGITRAARNLMSTVI